jgi:hypothetical protein
VGTRLLPGEFPQARRRLSERRRPGNRQAKHCSEHDGGSNLATGRMKSFFFRVSLGSQRKS